MLEQFSPSNFNKKIAISIDLWNTEQANYQQVAKVKKRNFGILLYSILAIVLAAGSFVMLARIKLAILISLIVIGLLILVFFIIKNLQKRNLSEWQQRANRLFAPSIKFSIFAAFFGNLKANQDIKMARKVLNNSFLEKEIEIKELAFQYEGIFANQPLLINYVIEKQLVGSKKIAFFNLVKKENSNIQYFFCLKKQELKNTKVPDFQHFGYFTDLENTFNFYSAQRGSLAAFLEKNEMILQRLSNLSLNFLAVSIIDNKINCTFDEQLFDFWEKIEISQTLTASHLEHYYGQLSKLSTLISLLQNLELPTESES